MRSWLIRYPSALLILLVVRLLEPFILIRTAKVENPAIGHLSLPIEMYLAERECGLHLPGQRFMDIFFLDGHSSNIFLEKKWCQCLCIYPRFLVEPFDSFNRFFLKRKKNMIPVRYWYDEEIPWSVYDIHGVLKKTKPHVVFTTDEEAECRETMRKLGLELGDKFVCFHARDSAFYKDGTSALRNSSISDSILAMKVLSQSGVKSVRIGAKVESALVLSDEQIIDYSSSGLRSEMLDLYLVSQSSFMVGSSSSGINCLAPTFRIPLVTVNFLEFGWADQWDEHSLFIPRKFWSIEMDRLLTFRELYSAGAHLFNSEEQFVEANLKSIYNTPEEIKSVVMEMVARLTGSWTVSLEDEELQNKFKSNWPIRKNGRPLPGRIGADFLRENVELLR